MFLKCIIYVGLLSVAAQKKSYEDYKVYDIVPTSKAQVQMLEHLKEDYLFWNDVIVVSDAARVLVAPDQDKEFLKYCESTGLDTKLTIKNLQELIDFQMTPVNIERNSHSSLGSFNWTMYHRVASIYAWLDELQALYPGILTTIEIGTTYEGRSIKGVIIDFRRDMRLGTPLIAMIEGGIHAREWISPATVTWIIKEFLTSEDTEVRFMAENFIWHIFPIVNPDGYEFTFTGNRLWRKNRNSADIMLYCIRPKLGLGIDLNRNFDYLWMTVGATKDPCTETYAGPSAGSELETKAISNYVLTLKNSGNLLYYIAFHSYAQMILIPYSHRSRHDYFEMPDTDDIYEIALQGAQRLKTVHGTNYRVGTSADLLYAASGTSFDWVKGYAEVPITMAFELRDWGEYGFFLPTKEIIPNNEEIMACLLEMDKTTRKLGYYQSIGQDVGEDIGHGEEAGGNEATGIAASVVSLMLSAAFMVITKLIKVFGF